MKVQAFVILSGYNFRAVVAFYRFAVAHEIPFYIIACGTSDPIFSTEYTEQAVEIRNGSVLKVDELQPLFSRLRERKHLDLLHILPSSEFLNRFFLKHRETFDKRGIVLHSGTSIQVENIPKILNVCSDALA